MSDACEAFERTAIQVLRHALVANQSSFERAGVRWELLDIRRSGETGPSYESEIGAYFWRDKNVVDALEFAIYRGDRPLFSEQDLSAWIEAAILDVLRRAGVPTPQ